jgi:hypothetical protein
VAPFEVIKKRYEDRGSLTDTGMTYDQVRADPTEAGVWLLDSKADRVVVNHNKEPASLLALAVSGLGLFPLQPTPSVDVIVGGQYGSEGKGHVCAHLAPGYDVLVRVGGPNAGHRVAYPPYDYIHLPSGTQSNKNARILIGPGATIKPSQIMKEIRECGLEGGPRLVIDEQAMIIEDDDAEIEVGALESIGSTKQGVGVATARKILNRGDKPIFGAKVRLARHCRELRPYVKPTAPYLEDAYASGRKIMLEGTQGTGLSIHHGNWPHVTSRETTAAGCLADAGISPRRVRKIIMLTRTYPIRVGGTSGPMGKEIDAQIIVDSRGCRCRRSKRQKSGPCPARNAGWPSTIRVRSSRQTRFDPKRPRTNRRPLFSAGPPRSSRAEFAIRGRTVMESQTVELGGADVRPRRRQRRNSSASGRLCRMTGHGRERNGGFGREPREAAMDSFTTDGETTTSSLVNRLISVLPDPSQRATRNPTNTPTSLGCDDGRRAMASRPRSGAIPGRVPPG